MSATSHTFQAMWPVLDEQINWTKLCRQALEEVPNLMRQSRAIPTGHGRFLFADSTHVAGSGKVSKWVLLYECPARPRRARRIPDLGKIRAERTARRECANTRPGLTPDQTRP